MSLSECLNFILHFIYYEVEHPEERTVKIISVLLFWKTQPPFCLCIKINRNCYTDINDAAVSYFGGADLYGPKVNNESSWCMGTVCVHLSWLSTDMTDHSSLR